MADRPADGSADGDTCDADEGKVRGGEGGKRVRSARSGSVGWRIPFPRRYAAWRALSVAERAPRTASILPKKKKIINYKKKKLF